MPLDGLNGTGPLVRAPLARLPKPSLEPGGPMPSTMPTERYQRHGGPPPVSEPSEAPDFESLSELAESLGLPGELTGATFLTGAQLSGDCTVQAFMLHGGAHACGMVDDIKAGLQANAGPFQVTLQGPYGAGRTVEVDPAVYQRLRDEGGLSPSEALTMVTRLAVAQAIEPGATIAWAEDGSMSLQGARGQEAGKGLNAQNFTSFCLTMGMPILDSTGIGQVVASYRHLGEVPPGLNGKQFLIFKPDADGVAHPHLVTARFATGADGKVESHFEFPDGSRVDKDTMAQWVQAYFKGDVAHGGGFNSTRRPKGFAYLP